MEIVKPCSRAGFKGIHAFYRRCIFYGAGSLLSLAARSAEKSIHKVSLAFAAIVLIMGRWGSSLGIRLPTPRTNAPRWLNHPHQYHNHGRNRPVDRTGRCRHSKIPVLAMHLKELPCPKHIRDIPKDLRTGNPHHHGIVSDNSTR